MGKTTKEIDMLRELAERLRQAAAAADGEAKRTSKRTTSVAVARPRRRETPTAPARDIRRIGAEGESVSSLP
jgi:hypothetical protein